MGMFDYVVCEYALPDGWVEPNGWEWLTKDFPDPYLTTYVIETDGILQRNSSHGKKSHLEKYTFTGEVEFYGSNIQCSGPPNYIVTRNDEPPLSKTYRVIFFYGQVHSIELIETYEWPNYKHLTHATWLEDERNYNWKQLRRD